MRMSGVKHHAAAARISVRARGAILNPWYSLPVHIVSLGSSSSRINNDDALKITRPCRIELERWGLNLFFRDNEIVFVASGDSREPLILVDPVLYFLIYRTFVNYNMIGGADDPDPNDYEYVDVVQFKVERIVSRNRESGFPHRMRKEELLDVTVRSLAQYLGVLNPTLYSALAYYLRGCENSRYFLVEFYKAVEVIKNALGGESKLLKALSPYGVSHKKLKEFGKACNDKVTSTLDIGRHAPMPDAPLYSVDLRTSEPRSLQVFESSTVVCRQVVDAYIAFLCESL